MYGARARIRNASEANRSLALGIDDIARLSRQALVRMLDDRKRAVRAGAIELKRTAGFQNAGGSDLGAMVFHPIRDVHENAVFVPRG
jgi:hypothetical protein